MNTETTVQWDGEQVCLVTGGAGFIGSYLVRELTGQGKRVVVFDFTPDASYIADCMDKVTFVYGDVADMPHLLEVMATHSVTHVFHLAYMLVPDTDHRLATAIRVNCEGFGNVMQAARLQNVERVVWASTQSVYGVAEAYPPGPVSEDIFVRPTTLYGACKLFNEHIARHFRTTHGLDNIGFRKAVVYGLGKSRRRDLSIAHLLIENAILGRPVEMPPVDYGANYVYVKDIVRAYLLAIQAPRPHHLVFNIGGSVHLSSEVLHLLQQRFPDLTVFRQPEYDLPHPMEVCDQDMTAARRELRYEPAYSLQAGIQDFVASIKQFGAQYRSAWAKFEARSLIG